MSFASLIFLTTGAILVWRLFTLGARTASAAEASAIILMTLYNEARERSSKEDRR